MDTLLPMLDGMAARLTRDSVAAAMPVQPRPQAVRAAIHRVVERHATMQGDVPAIVDGPRTVRYRELNARANALARHLMTHGFRRGDRALVRMDIGADLAIVLLGVLKAGGCYSWLPDAAVDSGWAQGIAIPAHDGTDRHVRLDIDHLLGGPVQPSPNLPVLTRGSEIACVLEDQDGSPLVLVPHATVVTLRNHRMAEPTHWTGEPAALDLWCVLMAGATIIVGNGALEAAAA